VWVGNFDNTANPLLVGAQAALPLWREISRALAALVPLRDHFEQAPGTLNVERIEVCRQTGDLDTSLCSDRTRTWFIPGVSPVKPSGVYRRIDIVIESGLRACMPEQGRTQSIVWEVWPSDLERMFALAGIVKPPPPEFEPACRPEPVPGRKLQIQLPKKGLVFYASLASGAKTEVALQAESDSAAGKLSWFVDGSFVGACAPGQTISVKVDPGRYHVLVSDESRVTASRVITVKAVP
jgi:penicillin-binding protein 1C